jgi:integrase
MASLYLRAGSPFWWIKFRDRDLKIKRASTGFRKGVGPDTRRAEQLRAEYTLRESNLQSASGDESWGRWVPQYLRLRYANAAPSLLRYSIAWRTLAMFLADREITLPRQLTRAHCLDYMDWRAQPDKRRGKYTAGHNTAHLEIKTLGILMAEAVLRNYAPYNPCRDLEIHRVKPKEKPELTPEIIQLIDVKINDQPESVRTFLRNSFDIARYHGCRISETHLNPLRDVEFNGDRCHITFRAKGGGDHTVPLHPKLLPLFQQLRASGKTETYPLPKSPAKTWFNFLTRIGVKRKLPGACFHSTRVTVASALARSSVSEKKAMAYLGHASTTVHRLYVRLRPDDLSDCADAIV